MGWGCGRGFCPGGGGGCRAPPNSWVCGPCVIRQFAPPLAPIEGRVSSGWVFLAPRGTPTSSGSNIPTAFLHITTWAKIFDMFVAFPSPQPQGPHRSVGVHHPNSRGHTEVWDSITPTQALRVVVVVLVDNWAPSAPINSLGRYP